MNCNNYLLLIDSMAQEKKSMEMCFDKSFFTHMLINNYITCDKKNYWSILISKIGFEFQKITFIMTKELNCY